MNCSIDGLELFSCALSNEDETALSILDPVSITVDVKPPSSHSRQTSVSPSQTPTDKVYSQTLLVCMLYCQYYEASDIPFTLEPVSQQPCLKRNASPWQLKPFSSFRSLSRLKSSSWTFVCRTMTLNSSWQLLSPCRTWAPSRRENNPSNPKEERWMVGCHSY